MAKSKRQRVRSNNRNNKKRKLGLKPNHKKNRPAPQNHHRDVAHDASTPSPPPDVTPDAILRPYPKETLIDFLADAALADPHLLRAVISAADVSLSHRKLFVFGLSWDATRETLFGTFSEFGPIEDCNVVVDKATSRSKGYGFVVFRTRSGALKALEKPEKKIGDRITHCQLASLGTTAKTQLSSTQPSAAGNEDISGRKVYVANVYFDVTQEKLRAFFAQFGEIESGPFGYDRFTGKPRGYAIFVYKTLEGARKALEEPIKVFEGHQIQCQLASDNNNQKGKNAVVSSDGNLNSQGLMGAAAQQQQLAAVAAAQSLAMSQTYTALLSQNPGYAALLTQNPGYAALLGQNPLLAAAALNPALAMNAAVGFVDPQGQGLAASSGVQSYLGAAYGSQGLAGLQGYQIYQDPQFGAAAAQPGSSFGGQLQ